MSSAALAAGTVIARYRIVSTLGAGGMGQVYLAQDTQLNRPVALKILPPELTDRPDRIGRFVQEAQAASALNHPNVAHIYEIGEAEGIHFIAMEYVDGQTLSAKAGGRPVPVAEILDIAVQAADALDEAHAKGVVHRDIKAANIMVTARGQVKVLDFGLAKVKGSPASGSSEMATQAITSPGVVMGTTQYMSPEQVLGKDLDGRSDIFSFGVVLYEMATGRLPFKGSTQTEIMQQIAQSQPDAVARFNYDVPVELERIIRKCLEKDRERRYQSARDLLVDLRNLKRDTDSGSRTVTGAVAAAPARKRVPRWLAAAAAVLAIGLAAGAYLLFRARTGEAVDSLAVLPFTNTGGDPNLEYLSDGITEELINSLTQIPKLKVMSRATVFTYKGKQPDPKQVGRDLHVAAVLMGRVTQRGENLAVQVDLVDTREGTQIWGQHYNRKSAEIQAVQEDIARQITDKMRMKLSSEAEARMAKRSTQNPEAYRLYLQGRFAISQSSEDRVAKALALFQQAIATDPAFALGYAGMADAYSYLGMDEVVAPKDAYPKAKEWAQRALQLDPEVGEAHTSLGIVNLVYDWDWPAAEKEFRRAMELNPGNAYVRHWYGHYLETMGRLAEGQVELQRALDMDPKSDMISFDMALNCYFNHQTAKALDLARKGRQEHPDNPILRAFLAWLLTQSGKGDQGLAELKDLHPLAERIPQLKWLIAETNIYAGKQSEARKMLAELEATGRKQYVSPVSLATLRLALGDTDAGFADLERGYQVRASAVPSIVFDPLFDRYRSDPRFVALAKKLNLPLEPKRAPL